MSINDSQIPTDPPLTEEDVIIELGWLELWHALREAPDTEDE